MDILDVLPKLRKGFKLHLGMTVQLSATVMIFADTERPFSVG